MAAKNLVIVESPAKAKTLEKYLGRDFQVRARARGAAHTDLRAVLAIVADDDVDVLTLLRERQRRTLGIVPLLQDIFRPLVASPHQQIFFGLPAIHRLSLCAGIEAFPDFLQEGNIVLYLLVSFPVPGRTVAGRDLRSEISLGYQCAIQP